MLLPPNFTLAYVVLNKEETLIIPFACELIRVKQRVWGPIIAKAHDIKNYKKMLVSVINRVISWQCIYKRQEEYCL